jgi:hypothetical protein
MRYLNIEAIMKQKDELDKNLIKLIKASRNILDQAVFGPVDELLEESRNILPGLNDEL